MLFSASSWAEVRLAAPGEAMPEIGVGGWLLLAVSLARGLGERDRSSESAGRSPGQWGQRGQQLRSAGALSSKQAFGDGFLCLVEAMGNMMLAWVGMA